MSNFYGSIDLTQLGEIIRKHPELVKVSERNQHKYLGVDIIEKDAVDEYGNKGFIKVSCKKENRKEGVKYYIANVKLSQYQDNAPMQGQYTQQPATSPQTSVATPENSGDDLPF